MDYSEVDYGDLSDEELADEIAGLDREIENCQATLRKIVKGLKSKTQLRESLIDIASKKKQFKGWPKSVRGRV